MLPSRRHLQKAFLNYYRVPLQVPFRQFRNGLIYFAVGMMTVLMAVANIDSSIQQEIIVLLGLILTAIGFLIAMTAQMRILISRLVQFFAKEDS